MDRYPLLVTPNFKMRTPKKNEAYAFWTLPVFPYYAGGRVVKIQANASGEERIITLWGKPSARFKAIYFTDRKRGKYLLRRLRQSQIDFMENLAFIRDVIMVGVDKAVDNAGIKRKAVKK